jgi:arylsulfatase A-like enzyme
LTVLLTFLVGCASGGREIDSGPNILLIVIDAMRADHLGCYGYERETSPALDRLAVSGVVFETAIASSSTTVISMASLFTSLHPIEHGVRYSTVYGQRHRVADSEQGESPVQTQTLNEDLTTLAEELNAHGYETMSVMTNPFLKESHGFGQGFQYFTEGELKANEVVDEFLGWLEGQSGSPFFALLHFMDVHNPYRPPSPYNTMFDSRKAGLSPETSEKVLAENVVTGTSFFQLLNQGKIEVDPEYIEGIVGLYDGEIRLVDDVLNRLFDRLETTGLLNDTVIVVTADHGDEFMEHGRIGHGVLLYESLIRVPLILLLPPGSSAGRRVAEPVGLVDLMPTLLDLGGVPVPEDLSGRSLVPLIMADSREPWEGRALFSEYNTNISRRESIRTDRYKLIRTLRFEPFDADIVPNGHKETALDGSLRPRKLVGVKTELYDLVRDPDELYNISANNSRLLDDLLTRLDAHLEGLVPRTVPEHLLKEIDPGMEERLKALGYLK